MEKQDDGTPSREELERELLLKDEVIAKLQLEKTELEQEYEDKITELETGLKLLN
jgi:hypothetical protein